MDEKPQGGAEGGAGLLDEWMTRDELARELGVSIDTMARWHSQRIGPPCVRMGRRTLYRRTAVREWMVSRERGNAALRAK